MPLVSTPRIRLTIALALSSLICSCAFQVRPTEYASAADVADEWNRALQDDQRGRGMDVAEAIARCTSRQDTPYAIGPEDEIKVTVTGRSELGGVKTVGPDGAIGLPLAGTVKVAGFTRESAAAAVREGLAPFFSNELEVSVEVRTYRNNHVFVLGNVVQPGRYELRGDGTLLQALAEAQGFAPTEDGSPMTVCSIMRGRDQAFEVDTAQLLRGGQLGLNVPLHNGDVVFFPEPDLEMVLVMGEVKNAGAVTIRSTLDVVQALARAGGTTENADLSSLWLVRRARPEGQRGPVHIDFKRLLEQGDQRVNLQLTQGDILYVGRSGMGDLGYVLRQISPAFSSLTFGLAVTEQ